MRLQRREPDTEALFLLYLKIEEVETIRVNCNFYYGKYSNVYILEVLIMAIDKASLRRRQIMIGRAKKMFDEGRTWKEICEELNVSESTIRSIRHTIEQAEINRHK